MNFCSASCDRTRKDEDLAEEIESHLAHEQDANGARGSASGRSAAAGSLRFGNPRTTRERVWRYRSFPGSKIYGAIFASLCARSPRHPALPSSPFS